MAANIDLKAIDRVEILTLQDNYIDLVAQDDSEIVHVIPTHCTGRQAVLEIEKQMPECFILNMAGTKLTFAA